MSGKYRILVAAFAHVVLPLVAGAAIYLGWRSPNLLAFRIMDHLGVATFIPRPSFRLPHFIAYCVPDGCWVYAGTAWMLLIWRGFVPWTAVFLLLALAGEFGQAAGMVGGTYDFRDVVAYVGAFALSLLWGSRCKSTFGPCSAFS